VLSRALQVFYCAAGYCLQCIVHGPSRRRMREKYGLEEAPFDDCLTTFLCAVSLLATPHICVSIAHH